VLILVGAKALRASSLFSAFGLLYQLPLLLYVFLVLAGSSVFFLALQRPWAGSKQLKANQVNFDTQRAPHPIHHYTNFAHHYQQITYITTI
jgi:hypothetical protein